MIEIKRQEIEEIKPIEKLQRILQIFDVEIRLLVLESLMCKGGSEIGLCNSIHSIENWLRMVKPTRISTIDLSNKPKLMLA